jgi:hypothetical protein
MKLLIICFSLTYDQLFTIKVSVDMASLLANGHSFVISKNLSFSDYFVLTMLVADAVFTFDR